VFQISPHPTFTAPVPLSRPGVSKPIDVMFTFKHKNRLQAVAWMAQKDKLDDVELLDQAIVGWAGMQDAQGADVPYSTAALSDLISEFTPARGEIFRSYLTELTEAKKKT
jgi:Phage tail assembly chaperone